MNVINSEKKIFVDFEKEFYKDRLEALIPTFTDKVQGILKSYARFNLFFCGLIFCEILYLFFHFAFLAQGFVLAIHLALIFATIFSYYTLRLYFQTKKSERFFKLKNEFMESVHSHLKEYEGLPDYHLVIANMCCKLAAGLHGKEYQVYTFPNWLNFLSFSLDRICCWCFWKDIHGMQELLLHAAVDAHVKLVQIEPTNLEVHVGLANAYVMLSGLYVDPRTVDGMEEDAWIPPNKYQNQFKEKFRAAAEKAIEEFKILSDYAPNDPWVYAQLAFSYRDLQMPKEEIKAYESILQLCPEDKETLFKLGKLYFEQGYNSKGLRVYEILKKSNYKKAENLILFYGA